MISAKGRFGNINVDGKYNSPSFQISLDDPNFWDNIEDGIKPLVKVFIDKGYTTSSSCEGHRYQRNYKRIFDYARITIDFSHESEIENLLLCVKNYNKVRGFDIIGAWIPSDSETNRTRKYSTDGEICLIISIVPQEKYKNKEDVKQEIVQFSKYLDENLQNYKSYY